VTALARICIIGVVLLLLAVLFARAALPVIISGATTPTQPDELLNLNQN
jgi:hypothetical protein